MQQGYGLVIIFAAIILTAGCLSGQEMQNQAQGDTSEAPQEVTVEITANGFEPETVTVQQGGTVTWVNQDTRGHWPASAVHPSHTVYPDSGIEKCGTDAESEIFDACGDLEQGEAYTFTFTETGEWKYHDHRNPSMTGTVIVE